MQYHILLLALTAIVSAKQGIAADLRARQFTNITQAAPVDNPQTTFGAAAAAIQSAIAAGQALRSATDATLGPITYATVSIGAAAIQTSTIISTSPVDSTTTSVATVSPSVYVDEPAAETPVPVQSLVATPRSGFPVAASPSPSTSILSVITTSTPSTSVIPAITTLTPSTLTPANGASIGSQGTITVDGNLYTTVVVAEYVTVPTQATTFYENGIAYVASYAGETITVTDCPCTRSARITVMTTTLCSSCVPAKQTALPVQSASNTTNLAGNVVFTGSAKGMLPSTMTTMLTFATIIITTTLLL